MKYFIGKVILTIGGGGDKIYVVEDKDKVSSEVKSIQSRGFKDMMKSDPNFKPQLTTEDEEEAKAGPLKTEEEKQQEYFSNTSKVETAKEKEEKEKEAQIIQICKGKYHLIKLTSDGKVRCSGKPYFGVTGLGGAAYSETTKLLPNLANIKIVQISCGMFHSLALAENGDLYTWGMGFEGQLGLKLKYKVASSPRYLQFFYRKPIKFISCGHNYSLAITNEGIVYGWGENKLEQLGLGHIQIVENQTQIPILEK